MATNQEKHEACVKSANRCGNTHAFASLAQRKESSNDQEPILERCGTAFTRILATDHPTRGFVPCAHLDMATERNCVRLGPSQQPKCSSPWLHQSRYRGAVLRTELHSHRELGTFYRSSHQ